MRSSFYGLETARRGMFTQQSAIYTTGHNISNANTPGYSRQRVNFTQTTPYPQIGMNRPQIPGQMGTGVEAGSVQRIREGFLDMQFRTENNKVGYYGALSESLQKMEGIMNEPSESGLQNTLDKFWSSLQDLAGHTENAGARDVVAARGQMVADTFNYYYNSLARIQKDIGQEIDVKIKEVNSIIDQIDSLNKQISEVEPHGYLPNDLYDERDYLVDQLSQKINIKVTNVKPDKYGVASSISEGLYNIEVVSEDGNSYNPPLNLISVTKSGMLGTNKLEKKINADGAITSISVGTKDIPNFKFKGELAGLIESFGYVDAGGNTKGYYPDMLKNLNTMASAFAKEFNKIHSEGYALGGTTPSGENFFEFDPNNPAQSLKVREEIVKDPSKIAAGDGNGDAGNNKNAQRLADLKTKSFADYDDPNVKTLPGNLDSYYSGVIGKLGVDSQSVQKNLKNSAALVHSVDYNRQAVSGVSLDEEFTNLIKYQHAYTASARNITVIDEMLDKVINGMGIVGR